MKPLKVQGLTDSPSETVNAAFWHLGACFPVGWVLSGFLPPQVNVKLYTTPPRKEGVLTGVTHPLLYSFHPVQGLVHSSCSMEVCLLCEWLNESQVWSQNMGILDLESPLQDTKPHRACLGVAD